VSKCLYQIVCPFFRRRFPIHEVMYRQHTEHYCQNEGRECAILAVMKASSFLDVPPDLYPNQTWRVEEILESKEAARRD
jgi:hypothetical protein